MKHLVLLYSIFLLEAHLQAQGGPDYLPAIHTEAEFESLSVPPVVQGSEVELTTKYLIPATDDPELLHPVFQNVSLEAFHWEFMAKVFPQYFPDFSIEEYNSLVQRRATRRYFAGTLSRLNTPNGVIYGFTIFFDTLDSTEQLTVDEVRGVYNALSQVFDLRPFFYAPMGELQKLAAEQWQNPDFPIYLGTVDSSFQAYTRGVGYGYVRVMDLGEFQEANATGLITWQDILILTIAPPDIEGVVAGVITAQIQSELSHIAIRTARRGTPNAFVSDATDIFSPFDDQLVRLEVDLASFTVEEATLPDAEEWWKEHRPSLSRQPTFDENYNKLDSFLEMDLSSPSEAVARFGGKATNFARLQRLMDQGLFEGPPEKYMEPGFGIPMHYYLEFMRSNFIVVEDSRQLSYEDYLEELFAREDFQSNPRVRFEALADFRDFARQNGVVSPGLVANVALRINETFGSTTRMIRLRSSSNVEDDPEFNGAGLYESTSGCAADSFDVGDTGPSQCNPLQPEERTIERGLKKVWASLWTYRAFEERAWYQIPQNKSVMGIMVTRAFLDEDANGVSFTGNPSNALDPLYVVTVQKGEASVVRPEPGVSVEKNILELTDGSVTFIKRARRSSLVPDGEFVLSEEKLGELGALLYVIDQNMPVELGEHSREDVLFDVEFKLEKDNSLAIKQVRPFLLSIPAITGPTFELEIPAGTTACGVFADGRSPEGELMHKSQVSLIPGTHLLPSDTGIFSLDLMEEVLFGPSQKKLESITAGRFERDFSTGIDGKVVYTFIYKQTFRLAGGELFKIEIRFPNFEALDGEAVEKTLILDDAFMTDRLVMSRSVEGESNTLVRYSSCNYETIPLWDIRAELEDGSTMRLEERFREPTSGSSPANLMAATLNLSGVEVEIRDYWQLVYAALHHNFNPQYWMMLTSPLDVPGVGSVHVVELRAPESDGSQPAQVRFLGAIFEELAQPKVTFFWKGLMGEEPPEGFRRGDADSNGRTNVSDIVFILRHIFLSATHPTCPDAADYDDDGTIEITDPIFLLNYLFRSVDITFPPGPNKCGLDPTSDFLGECDYPNCN